MKLLRLGVSNYRGIGSSPVWVDLQKRVNVLVGVNNAGKSTVLNALLRLNELRKAEDVPDTAPPFLKDEDRHLNNRSLSFRTHFEWIADEQDRGFRESLLGKKLAMVVQFETKKPILLATSMDDWAEEDQITLYKNTHGGKAPLTSPHPDLQDFKRQQSLELSLSFLRESLPLFQRIPEFRRMEKNGSDDRLVEGERYGSNLIRMLGLWKSPKPGFDANRTKFFEIQRLVRQLLHEDVELEIPNNTDPQLVIRLGGGPGRDLGHYGTGLHELVLLCTALFHFEREIACIEEPEKHLHPRLQREFIHFLLSSKEIQTASLVLTTHSNVFMQASSEVALTHIVKAGLVTTPRPILGDGDALAVLGDLGISAGDLLQTNCVIWVEGPSDKIYLKRWIDLYVEAFGLPAELKGMPLRDGVEYTISFYGSWPILKHMDGRRDLARNEDDIAATATDDGEEVDEAEEGEEEEEEVCAVPSPELVPLLRINQNSLIILDSDLGSECDLDAEGLPKRDADGVPEKLRTTKKVFLKSCAEAEPPVPTIVTAGREIENYIPPECFEGAFPKLEGKAFEYGLLSKIDLCLKEALGRQGDFPYGRAKTRHAVRIAPQMDKTVFDGAKGVKLKELVDQIMKKITSSNMRFSPAEQPPEEKQREIDRLRKEVAEKDSENQMLKRLLATEGLARAEPIGEQEAPGDAGGRPFEAGAQAADDFGGRSLEAGAQAVEEVFELPGGERPAPVALPKPSPVFTKQPSRRKAEPEQAEGAPATPLASQGRRGDPAKSKQKSPSTRNEGDGKPKRQGPPREQRGRIIDEGEPG